MGVKLLKQPGAFRENNLNTVTRCKMAALEQAREIPKRLSWQARVRITLIENEKMQRMMKSSTIVDKTSQYTCSMPNLKLRFNSYIPAAPVVKGRVLRLAQEQIRNSKQNGEPQSACERLQVIIRTYCHLPESSGESCFIFPISRMIPKNILKVDGIQRKART